MRSAEKFFGLEPEKPSGVLVVDKPEGISSHDAVLAVRRAFGIQKVGHVGTLDPLATGVLPVCVNEATKISRFLSEEDRSYVGTLRLGVHTDTQDATGKVLSEGDYRGVERQMLEKAIAAHTGSIEQVPPMFSAIKRSGQPLYRLARKGKVVDRPARRIEVMEFRLEAFDPPDARFAIVCSKGTYIRTLCADIGAKLGCGAHLAELRRLRSGPFGIDRAVRLGDLRPLAEQGRLTDLLIAMDEALPRLAALHVSNALADRIRHGVPVSPDVLEKTRTSPIQAGELVKILSPGNRMVAVAEGIGRGYPTPNRPHGRLGLRTIRVFH